MFAVRGAPGNRSPSLYFFYVRLKQRIFMTFALALSAFLASIISGALAMAGGTILMGIYVLFMPVHSAMILHGLTQSVSNFSRVIFLYQHIYWPVIVPYILGSLGSLGGFFLVTLVPSKEFIFIFIGLF